MDFVLKGSKKNTIDWLIDWLIKLARRNGQTYKLQTRPYRPPIGRDFIKRIFIKALITIEGIKPTFFEPLLPSHCNKEWIVIEHPHIVLFHTKTVVFCKEVISIFFTLFSQGQMNEALRIAISKQLGFSNRINLDGTEYYK